MGQLAETNPQKLKCLCHWKTGWCKQRLQEHQKLSPAGQNIHIPNSSEIRAGEKEKGAAVNPLGSGTAAVSHSPVRSISGSALWAKGCWELLLENSTKSHVLHETSSEDISSSPENVLTYFADLQKTIMKLRIYKE